MARAQMPYGTGMGGVPAAMPGYPGMYSQAQYPGAYMAAPYGLHAPYLGAVHPGYAGYPQVPAAPPALGPPARSARGPPGTAGVCFKRGLAWRGRPASVVLQKPFWSACRARHVRARQQ